MTIHQDIQAQIINLNAVIAKCEAETNDPNCEACKEMIADRDRLVKQQINKSEIAHTQDALNAWEGGACNLRALANHFNQAVKDLSEGRGSNALNDHPAIRLYLAQMAFIAGIGIGDCADADKQALEFIEKHQAALTSAE